MPEQGELHKLQFSLFSFFFFLLRFVCVSTPSVVQCNICQCLSVRGWLAAVQTLFG